jgi:hypothetical protein
MINKNHFYGFLCGMLVYITQFDVKNLIPVAILSIGVMARHYSFKRGSAIQRLGIPILLTFMVLQTLLFKMDELVIASRFLMYPVLLFLAYSIRINYQFMVAFSYVVITIFLIDFLFNAHALIFGEDILGRLLGRRPGDIFPRLIGVYGFSFISIGVTVSALIAGLFIKKYWIVFLAVIILFLTGSIRGSVYSLVFISAIISTKLFSNKRLRFSLAVACGLTVVFGTFIFSDLSSNNLRILSFGYGFREILELPILGNSGFLPIEKGPNDGMTLDLLILSGNAEQQLMNFAIHFGIPILILFIAIVYSLTPTLNTSQGNCNKHILFVQSVSIFVITADLFFGHVFTFFPFAIYSMLLLLSLNKHVYKVQYPNKLNQ